MSKELINEINENSQILIERNESKETKKLNEKEITHKLRKNFFLMIIILIISVPLVVFLTFGKRIKEDNKNLKNKKIAPKTKVYLQTTASSPEFSAVYNAPSSDKLIKLIETSNAGIYRYGQEMEIDGMKSNITRILKFDTVGEHQVNFRLNNTLTTMELMFSKCTELTQVDFTQLDTSKVVNMANLFYGCSSLVSVEWGAIDTSQVTRMDGMFNGCVSLSSIELSLFDTSQVVSFGSMFHNCTSLVSLDLSAFKTENLIFMTYMFNGCSSLNEIDISGINTLNVTFQYNIFKGLPKSGTIIYNPDLLLPRIVKSIPEGWKKIEG